MTQSGQGEEPSARTAREGIVLPSDGGEPLLPGMTGARAPQHTGPHTGPQPGQQPPTSAPAGGQAWGQPWGPDQHQAPAPPPGQGWAEPQTQQWTTPDASTPWGAPEQLGSLPDQPGALPPETAQTPGYGAETHGTHSSAYGDSAYGAQPAYAPDQLPAAIPQGGNDGYGHHGSAAPLPSGAADGYGSSTTGGALPPATDGYGSSGAYPSSSAGAPLPPAVHGFPSAPLPAVDEGATQYIPPVAAAPVDEGATQFLPPVPAPGAEGATQFLPPVAPGALPPEVPADGTQFLGRVPQGGAGPLPPVSHPDAEATQYIAPVPAQGGAAPYGVRPGGPEDRQPPAEFDNLFRSGPGGEPPAASTQQMPRFQQPPQQPQAPYGAESAYAQPSYDPPGQGGGRGAGAKEGGKRSRVPVIAGVGIAIAVVGIGAGALLSGGGGGKSDNNKTVSATAPATDGSSSAADPAKQQAVALDKLLADSGSSRASVIRAVANVKACNDLSGSASDLRDAAKQRAELVTKLSQLTVDKLPDNAALTAALTNAWKASAAADNHYATWADQVSGKKGCKKGQARTTGQTAAGNRASGTASNQKVKAAALWNTIAKTYGLTERQPTQL